LDSHSLSSHRSQPNLQITAEAEVVGMQVVALCRPPRLPAPPPDGVSDHTATLRHNSQRTKPVRGQTGRVGTGRRF